MQLPSYYAILGRRSTRETDSGSFDTQADFKYTHTHKQKNFIHLPAFRRRPNIRFEDAPSRSILCHRGPNCNEHSSKISKFIFERERLRFSLLPLRTVKTEFVFTVYSIVKGNYIAKYIIV